ncbi:MAG: hypothetical protein K8T20_19620 [Planctomycetes bacterium]|nr:hypothetical protein [Planctomycetota bacterium]
MNPGPSYGARHIVVGALMVVGGAVIVALTWHDTGTQGLLNFPSIGGLVFVAFGIAGICRKRNTAK